MTDDLIKTLITQMSPWLAMALAVAWVSLVLMIIVWLSVKPNKLSHRETMARLQNEHEERTLTINRSAPKQIEQVKPTKQRDDY